MVLVDYSSSDDEDGANAVAAVTTSKVTISTVTTAAVSPGTAATPSSLPPLPRQFHDLYASTVRTSTADDPSLHHGRTRAIPHVAGQWPSHVSIEWFPSPAQHNRLKDLVTSLQSALPGSTVYSFLTSDLGAPLPLHISLSRPFVLQTAEKDDFLAGLVASLSSSNIEPFDVCFSELYWYRGPDTDRAFLVLRVETTSSPKNTPLVSLLDRCNKQVAAIGQPTLYASGNNTDTATSFHVSIAWTLDKDVVSWHEKTSTVYNEWKKQSPDPMGFHIESVKVKIGNGVTDIPLGRKGSAAKKSLFGL